METKTCMKWLSTCLLLSMMLAFAIAPVSAGPLRGAAAVDGDGLMVVSPSSVTYGSGAGTFTFTFTANADFSSGSQVEIDIPSGWSAPTTAAGAGHVSWYSGTCTLAGAPPVGITGMSIFIDLASCPTNAYFTVTYANATPGAVSGSPYTFVTWSDIGTGGSGLVHITAPAPTVAVNPKTLTVSATGLTPASKTYDGGTSTTLTIGSPTLVGMVGGDSVTLVTGSAAANFSDKHAGTAKTVQISGLTLGGGQAGNYALTQPTRTANISQRAITVSAVTDTKGYDGGVSSSGVPGITAGALQGSDTASWTQTFNNKNAGTGNKVLTPAGVVSDGNSGNDYTYTYATFNTGTINKKAITVNAETDSKVYDGTTASNGVPLVTPGLAGTDTAGFTQTFDTRNIGSGKTLAVAGMANDGNGGNNYSYTFIPDTTGVITAKALTVSAAGLTPNNKAYDGTNGATLVIGSPTLTGVVSPDVVTLVTSGAAASFIDKHVGTAKTVNISGLTLGGGGAGNYSLTQPTRSANVTARAITITAVTDTREYDGSVTSVGVPTLTSGTIAPGDSAPAWTQSFNSKHAGAGKVLTPAGLVTDGNSGSNYAYTYASATGVINKKAITVSAVTSSKAYDGNASASGVPSLSVGTPLAAGDSEPVWTETFSNKNAGSGKTLNAAGAVIDGNGGNNYSYNFVPDSTGAISVRAITVTARTDTKAFDGTSASTLAPNITPDLVGADTSAFIQTFDNPNVGSGKTLTPSGTVNDGNGGLNYAISFAPAITTGVINKADAALTVTNSPVTYSGLPQAATVSSGGVAGTLSNILYNGSATVPTGAGVYPVTADFAPTDTADYNNLTGASAGSFVINKATPTAVLAVSNSPVLYSGVPKIATIQITSSSVTGTAGNILYNGSVTAPTNAGSYAVSADFVPADSANYNTLSGLSAGNFVIQMERIKNGGFNSYSGAAKIPTFWTATNFAVTDGKFTTSKKEGLASIKIAGLPGKSKTLTQTIMLSGVAGDALSFSFWAKGAAIPAAGVCQAQVLVYNGSALKLTKTILCRTGTYASFQKKTLSFNTTTAYTKIVIRFTYNKASGTVWFDLASLIR